MRIAILLLIITSSRLFSLACNDSILIVKYQMKKIYSSNLAEYIAQERDSNFVKQLDSTLQVNSERLFSKFNHRISSPIKIQVFPEFNITTCVCGEDTLKNASALACTYYKKINMASSASKGFFYENREPGLVVLHEYAHAITFDIIGEKKMWSLPPWLRESLAIQTEYAPRYKSSFAMEYVQKKIQASDVPSLKVLCNKYTTIDYPGVWTGWFSEYITYKYGWLAMLELMKNNGDLSKTLGVSYKKINTEWLNYMKEKLTKMEHQ